MKPKKESSGDEREREFSIEILKRKEIVKKGTGQ